MQAHLEGRMAWSCEGGVGSMAMWTKWGSWRQLWQSLSGVAQEGVSSSQRDRPVCSVDALGGGYSCPSIPTFIGCDHVSTREGHPVCWGGQMLSFCDEQLDERSF